MNDAVVTIHHIGGRHRYTPVKIPPARAKAAQSKGWRPPEPIWFAVGALTGLLTNSHRELADEMKYAFQMVGLGKEIYQVCLLYAIARLQQRSQISR